MRLPTYIRVINRELHIPQISIDCKIRLTPAHRLHDYGMITDKISLANSTFRLSAVVHPGLHSIKRVRESSLDLSAASLGVP